MMTRFNKWLSLFMGSAFVGLLVLGFLKGFESVGALLEVISVIWLGLFTNNVISESGIVNENSRILREMGIKEVSTVGNISDVEMDRIFRKCETIKICVIAKSYFLKNHKASIVDALKDGADIRILIAQEDSVFLNDLTEQLRAIGHEKKEGMLDVTQAQEIKDAKEFVCDLRKEVGLDQAGEGSPKGKIEIRQYRSEYRTKFILGFTKPNDKEKGTIYGYYNFGLPVRAPAEYPLFSGSVSVTKRNKYLESLEEKDQHGSKERNKKNLHVIFDLDLHFNYLWDKYAPSKE